MTSTTEITPHRLNSGFTWQPVPRRGGLATPEQCDAFDRDGYVLMKNVLDPTQVDAVRELIDRVEAEENAQLHERDTTNDISAADAISFTALLVSRHELVREFATQQVFGQLAADFLASDARIYWDQAVYKRPEPSREFPWHQDTGYTFTLPQHYLTCWVPLVDATIDNGCPWVLPGLHVNGTLKHRWTDWGWQCIEQADEMVPVEAGVGDVVCFTSLLPHRTGPNVTDGIRKAYILQYCAEGMIAYPPIPQKDESRQFVVTKDGAPVTPS